ncbi:transmembrane protein 205 [Cygnus atratus]|uniref:transmembrane protein 205 n=1 Tax=Cygnus atratus TaxID=8868 RepID=UPI0015D5CD5B|nr:transmembrane protein 205 [Cygnus atratus]
MEGPGPSQGTTLTNAEPSNAVKLLHLLLLSTFWGMQIWVTFVAGLVMRSRLPRHTYGFIQRELFPYYFHIGSTCAFLNLTLFAMYHPSELLSEEETTQIIVFFVCVAVSALNAQWFGQATSDIAADMHRIERGRGLGQEVGLFAGESCRELRASDPSYGQLARQLALYRAASALCNLCCIACNGFSLYYLAAHLSAL